MKKLAIFLSIVTAATLLSCSSKKQPVVFSKNMLEEQVFKINTNQDTILETLHGAKVKLRAGSFNVNGIVSLEIKEAYTPAEILAAGLTTESNGKPLRSGGMIYINAKKDGKNLKLLLPAKLSVPNKYFDEAMQVFKGIETDTGSVNWIDPVSVDSTPQQQKWLAGKMVFTAKCASCHRIFADRTGPGLQNVEFRGQWNNRKRLVDFIRTPNTFLANDEYCINLWKKYKGVMTGFRDMNEAVVDAIIYYINSETARPGAKEQEQFFYDSLSKVNQQGKKDTEKLAISDWPPEFEDIPCPDDTIYKSIKKQDITFLENDTSIIPGYSDPAIKKAADMEALRNGFTDPNPTAGMYDFEIKTLGWYNIDAYVEGYSGTINATVEVEVAGAAIPDLHLYLFCPSQKMLSVSNRQSGNIYSFNKINNGVPLFKGDKAIAFAFGSKGDIIYYGIKEFRIIETQRILLTLLESTPEQLRNEFYARNISGVDIGIEQKEKVIIKRDCDLLNPKNDTAAAK